MSWKDISSMVKVAKNKKSLPSNHAVSYGPPSVKNWMAFIAN